jgi:chromosome partitioning protein
MQTIVLATQKGGSGKSTLAIGLALAAIEAGHTVRLIETDSQGTLSNWQSRRPYAEPTVEPVYAASDVEARLQSLDRDGVTLTIIDTSGGVSAATTSARPPVLAYGCASDATIRMDNGGRVGFDGRFGSVACVGGAT